MVERRRTEDLLALEMEQHIEDKVRILLVEHERVDAANTANVLNKIEEMRKEFMSAFPEGNPRAHEEFHRDAIEVIRDLRGLLREVRNKTVVGVVWSVIGLAGTATWFYIKAKLGAG